jgi:DNA/RNA-binding domain of Phe-tRNA-synthetase-like protein
VDGQDRLICRLDLRQADFSKVTTQTKNALVIVEGTAGQASERTRQAFAEAIEIVTRYCGGTAEVIARPAECHSKLACSERQD